MATQVGRLTIIPKIALGRISDQATAYVGYATVRNYTGGLPVQAVGWHIVHTLVAAGMAEKLRFQLLKLI